MSIGFSPHPSALRRNFYNERHITGEERMPGIAEFYCDAPSCDLEFPSGWGYSMYVIDDDGERITRPHPGERAKAREVVGHDATEAEIDERTGFNYHCICVDCAEQFERDPVRDDVLCPGCGSSAVEFLIEVVGYPCPRCGEGTITAEDTGAIA
jgi:ribosomal protein S27AE